MLQKRNQKQSGIRTSANIETQAFLAPFWEPVWHQLDIILEPWMPHGTPGAPDKHLGFIFESWVPPLGTLWGPFGLLWDPLGALLGAFGSPLGTFWLHFGHPGTTLETFNGVLASLCSP